MDPGFIADISKEALYLLIVTSLPVLLVSLVIGLVVSLLQALTQIQENTLTFVPKILAIYLSMLFIAPYIYTRLKIFMDRIIQHITG